MLFTKLNKYQPNFSFTILDIVLPSALPFALFIVADINFPISSLPEKDIYTYEDIIMLNLNDKKVIENGCRIVLGSHKPDLINQTFWDDLKTLGIQILKI